MTEPKLQPRKLIAENRRAKFDYFLDDSIEAGLVLKGSEVKSLRLGRANIAESYAAVEGDELVLIKLIAENKVQEFYAESLAILQKLLGAEFSSLHDVLSDAVELNRNLLKLPFQTDDVDLRCRFNIWEFYIGAIRGDPVPMIDKPLTYHIDRTTQAYQSWDDFCREVIWYGNKKGAYLYTNRSVEPHIAGIL